MKNILLLVIFCTLGYFGTPYLIKTETLEFSNQGVYEHDEVKIYQSVQGRNGREQAVGCYTVMLDVAAAASVSEAENLVTIHGNICEMGLILTPEGIIGNWQGEPWRDPWVAKKVVPVSALAENASALRIGKKEYLPLVVMSNGSSRQFDEPAGISIMDRKGNLVLNFPTLCTAENKSFKSVEFNPEFIAYAEPQARMFTSKRRVSRALSKLIKEAKAAANPQKKALIGAGIGALLALIIMIATRKPKARKTA